MTTSYLSESNIKKIHLTSLAWKSGLQFIESEIHFIDQLLQSYVFEPTTPNLFETIQEYKIDLKIMKKKIKDLKHKIQKHENQLGGILECDVKSRDHRYYEIHKELTVAYQNFEMDFNKLKADIFRYASGVLKKRKR